MPLSSRIHPQSDRELAGSKAKLRCIGDLGNRVTTIERGRRRLAWSASARLDIANSHRKRSVVRRSRPGPKRPTAQERRLVTEQQRGASTQRKKTSQQKSAHFRLTIVALLIDFQDDAII